MLYFSGAVGMLCDAIFEWLYWQYVVVRLVYNFKITVDIPVNCDLEGKNKHVMTVGNLMHLMLVLCSGEFAISGLCR